MNRLETDEMPKGTSPSYVNTIGYRNDIFIVEVLKKDEEKIYRCQICKTITGTALVFTHYIGCPNKDKYPLEPGASVSSVPKSIKSQIGIAVQNYELDSVLQTSPIEILKNLNQKTLILIGEEHTMYTSPFFNDIIVRQLKLIKLISCVYNNDIHVHHEMPESSRKILSKKKGWQQFNF